MKQQIVLIFLLLLGINSCKNNPVNSGVPQNHSPVLHSTILFPGVVAPNDSLVVICDASDPDGDTLVYDWYALSGSILRIKNAFPGQIALYNTHQNSQIFYAPDSMFVTAPRDTFAIQCAVRDGKGGTDVSAILRFVVIKDS
jgi:hypothetical protein